MAILGENIWSDTFWQIIFHKVNKKFPTWVPDRVDYSATLWLFGQTHYFMIANSFYFKIFIMVFYVPPKRSTLFVLNGNKHFDSIFCDLFLFLCGTTFMKLELLFEYDGIEGHSFLDE